jgi:2-methylcitrate dehydratase
VKAFGGRIVISLKNGEVIADELAVANAHTLGATPWTRPDYIRKFNALTEGILDPREASRFLDLVQNLPTLKPEELAGLTIALPPGKLAESESRGIFGWRI